MNLPETEMPAVETAAPAPAEGEGDETLRFRDPYWDDAFCAWWDPRLRTCC